MSGGDSCGVRRHPSVCLQLNISTLWRNSGIAGWVQKKNCLSVFDFCVQAVKRLNYFGEAEGFDVSTASLHDMQTVKDSLSNAFCTPPQGNLTKHSVDFNMTEQSGGGLGKLHVSLSTGSSN